MSSFRSPFTVKRVAQGTRVKGKFVEGASSTFQILASVQPLKGMEIELLPEGRRQSQAVKIFTDTKLNTTTALTNPDSLLAFGFEFEIISVEPWQSNVINHYKCIGVAKAP